MKRLLSGTLALLCLFGSLTSAAQPKPNPAVNAFWSKFQAAVAQDDKAAVAALSKFPLRMPYGVPSIKTKAQFINSGYKKIFDAATKQCFAAAKPEMESAKSKRFSIGCGEAMLYWFELVNGEYKFTAVDNINE